MNSLGKAAFPEYSYWDENTTDNPVRSDFMKLLIWMFWTVNMLVMGIINLKFIVTLVSDVWKEVLEKKEITLYNHRSEMNTSVYTIMGAFSKPRNIKAILVEIPKAENSNDPVVDMKADLKQAKKVNEELKQRVIEVQIELLNLRK
jgi:hypothetical protein